MCRSVRELAEAGGRELPASYAFAAYVYVCLDEDADAARRRADEHLAWRYSEPRFTGDLAGKYAVAGDVAHCLEGLTRFAEAGASHLVLSVVRRQDEEPLAALEAVATALLPSVRRDPAGV
jgi:alkanesulfonate monooxygenase SsuD/methylene tetrahydromethanopterin reductase-like flavin-dependent oxidoreductase (luciferase family)